GRSPSTCAGMRQSTHTRAGTRTMTSTENTPRLRADARRNRDRIIAAARTAFAEQGTDVPMEEIACAAGVGAGTLYRRFPDRDSLILAVRSEEHTSELQ